MKKRRGVVWGGGGRGGWGGGGVWGGGGGRGGGGGGVRELKTMTPAAEGAPRGAARAGGPPPFDPPTRGAEWGWAPPPRRPVPALGLLFERFCGTGGWSSGFRWIGRPLAGGVQKQESGFRDFRKCEYSSGPSQKSGLCNSRSKTVMFAVKWNVISWKSKKSSSFSLGIID